jgi:hypothetical protein
MTLVDSNNNGSSFGFNFSYLQDEHANAQPPGAEINLIKYHVERPVRRRTRVCPRHTGYCLSEIKAPKFQVLLIDQDNQTE